MTEDQAIKAADTLTAAWERAAAQGKCGWVCPDCCTGSPSGVPDACFYGHASCTEILLRDKAAARQ